jgi:hypothetical protein
MSDTDDLLARLRASSASTKLLLEQTDAVLQLDYELRAERRKTGTFLLDKTLPVLVAIVGGISYVLLEHKVHQDWQVWSFRIAGICLTLVILIALLRAWLEPILVYHSKAQLLAIEQRQPRPPEPWIAKRADLIELTSICLVALLLLVGLSLVGLATMLHPT